MSILDKVHEQYILCRADYGGQDPTTIYVTAKGRQRLLEEIRAEFERAFGTEEVLPFWAADGLFGMEIHVLGDDEVVIC